MEFILKKNQTALLKEFEELCEQHDTCRAVAAFISIGCHEVEAYKVFCSPPRFFAQRFSVHKMQFIEITESQFELLSNENDELRDAGYTDADAVFQEAALKTSQNWFE